MSSEANFITTVRSIRHDGSVTGEKIVNIGGIFMDQLVDTVQEITNVFVGTSASIIALALRKDLHFRELHSDFGTNDMNTIINILPWKGKIIL